MPLMWCLLSGHWFSVELLIMVERDRSTPLMSLTDDRLIRDCRKGNEAAWSALMEKYKHLVYSIPFKYGLSADEATDIFQEVFLELITHLPHLRQPKALPKWLIQTTSHKCYHHRRQRHRYSGEDSEGDERPDPALANIPHDIFADWEREQQLQETLGKLPARCQQLVQMLFFEEPRRPYVEIARSLGIATGSVGFIRGRCLEKLRAALKDLGFR